MEAQGPYLPQLQAWMGRHAPSYDVVAFYTYLYYTTWAGLPAAAGLVPTVLHPTAHDEPPLYVSLFETTFRHPTTLAYLTDEEAEIIDRRIPVQQPGEV